MNSSDDPGTFADLALRPELLAAITALGYEEPTPIQREAIPPLLEGRDLLGQAATGTGKTAAFALPLLQRLPAGRPDTAPSALVLVPTRELAMQVSEAIHRYGRDLGVRVLPIYGGQPIGRQLRAFERGVDVVVATPGRALDHLGRGTLRLRRGRGRRPRRGRRDARHGLRRRHRDDPRRDPTRAADRPVLGDAAPARRPDRSPAPPQPGPHGDRARGAPGGRSAARAPAGLHRAPRPQAGGAGAGARRRGPHGGHRVLPHPRRGRPAHRDPQRPRLPRRGAARRNEPGAARPA